VLYTFIYKLLIPNLSNQVKLPLTKLEPLSGLSNRQPLQPFPKLKLLPRELISVTELSSGSFGKTSLVEDTDTYTNTKYVVKTLIESEDHHPSANDIFNFEQEEKTIALLSPSKTCNPYIVCQHEIPDEYKKKFKGYNFGMEYIDGVELLELINCWISGHYKNKHAQFVKTIGCNFNNVLQIFSDIANGIQVFHRKNLIYRDLKPENIMLYIDKYNNVRAKIIDLGLVCGTIINIKCGAAGSAGYADYSTYYSKKSDVLSDIFSLGFVFFICLATFSNYCLNQSNYHNSAIPVLSYYLSENFFGERDTHGFVDKKYDDLNQLVNNIIYYEKTANNCLYSDCYTLVLSMITPQPQRHLRPQTTDVVLTELNSIKNKQIKPQSTPYNCNQRGGKPNTTYKKKYKKYKKYKQKYLNLKNK